MDGAGLSPAVFDGVRHIEGVRFSPADQTRDSKAALLQRALADAQARKFDQALAALNKILAIDPKFPPGLALLGPIQRRTGDLYGAIRTYETLVAIAPDDEEARDLLERWKRESELHDRMHLTVGDAFTVSFAGPQEAALADAALEALNRAFWRIGDLLGAYPLKSVTVVLYSDDQFRDLTRSPPWAAGAYDGIIRVPVRGALDNPKAFDRVLAHEFAHALVHTLAPHSVPSWLNEGLATALEAEEATFTARLARAGGPVPLSALQRPFGRFTEREAQLAYLTSAVAAQRLLDEAGGAAVVNLLRDLGAGVAFEAAFLHRIQRTLTDFEASLR